MKKFLKEKWLYLVTSFWALLNALMFLAMRVNYAGISKALGADAICKKYGILETLYPETFEGFITMFLPVVVCVVIFIGFIYTLLNCFLFKKHIIHTIIGLFLDVLFTVLIIVVIILGSKDYMFVIFPKFIKSLIVCLGIILLAVILFFPIEGKHSKLIKLCIISISIICSIIIGFGIRINYFSYKPVVYAVEDEYQIVFSTNDNSVVYVEIGDNKYYDLYAGSMKSVDLVHKVCVSQSVLDEAGSYKIVASQMNYRGPFGAFYGKTIEESYTFTAPNADDGIDYYAVSDVHESINGAVKAINSSKQRVSHLDFIVVCGDTVSDVEYTDNANLVNKMLFEATNGSIPVIYARGNHEVKGNTSEDLYKYVGSKNQKFYYSVSLDEGKIKAIVLDLGEDHNPYDKETDTNGDWWEYYNTDQFNSYRQEQTDFLNTFNSSDLNDSFNLVVCHIPLCYVNSRLDHENWKTEWCSILDNLPIDVALYGHQHELVPYDPNGVKPNYKIAHLVENVNFWGFMVGRSANSQDGECDNHGSSSYTGFLGHADMLLKTQKGMWTNALGEIVQVKLEWDSNDIKKDSYSFPFKTR